MLTLEAKFQENPEHYPDPDKRRDTAILEAIDLASRISCKVRVAVGVSFYLVSPMDSLQSVLERYRAIPGVREWIGAAELIGYKGESGPIQGERL